MAWVPMLVPPLLCASPWKWTVVQRCIICIIWQYGKMHIMRQTQNHGYSPCKAMIKNRDDRHSTMDSMRLLDVAIVMLLYIAMSTCQSWPGGISNNKSKNGRLDTLCALESIRPVVMAKKSKIWACPCSGRKSYASLLEDPGCAWFNVFPGQQSHPLSWSGSNNRNKIMGINLR